MADQPQTFQNINRAAMRAGLMLGAWSVLAVLLMNAGFQTPMLRSLSDAMLLLCPFIAWRLTNGYAVRQNKEHGYFTFGAGFSFCSLMGIYAMLWVLIPMGMLVNNEGTGPLTLYALEQMQTPEYRQALEQAGILADLDRMTNGKGLETLLTSVRSFNRADLLTLVLLANLFVNPIISILIGLFCQKRQR